MNLTDENCAFNHVQYRWEQAPAFGLNPTAR